MKHSFVFALFMLIAIPLFAQEEGDSDSDDDSEVFVDPAATHSSEQYMKEDIGSKTFDEKKWKDAVNGLNYEEEKLKEEKKKTEEDEAEDKKSKFNFALDPNIMRTISFIVVFCLFAFILYYVAQNTKLNKRSKKIKIKTAQEVVANVENIEELDTDGLLREALHGGDLRMAVRINYLLLLKRLNEAGLIAWKKDKTNRDYLSELYGRNDCYDNVRGLTLAYELVWYGERSVSNESFERLRGEFDSVNRIIKDVKPKE